MKYRYKPVINPVKRPCEPAIRLIQPQNGSLRLNYLCILYPLGSPTGVLKLPYVHVPGCTGRVVHDAATVQGGPGGYTGWYRVGIPGG